MRAASWTPNTQWIALAAGPYTCCPTCLRRLLFSGFYAIVAAIDGNYERAGFAVFAAMLCDTLDGRVARMTRTESAFGKEYDSLADMVSFGVAPAIVAYQWGVVRLFEYGKVWGRLGWLAAFTYAACAALRLARFNTRTGQDKGFFEGLPSPSAAAVVSGFIWSASEWRQPGLPGLILALLVTFSAGALMVSAFGYNSFKKLNTTGPVRFATFLLVPLGFVLIAATGPSTALLVIFGGYALSGPISGAFAACAATSGAAPKPGGMAGLWADGGPHRLSRCPRRGELAAAAPAGCGRCGCAGFNTCAARPGARCQQRFLGCRSRRSRRLHQMRSAPMPQSDGVRGGRPAGQMAGGWRGSWCRRRPAGRTLRGSRRRAAQFDAARHRARARSGVHRQRAQMSSARQSRSEARRSGAVPAIPGAPDRAAAPGHHAGGGPHRSPEPAR